ncbi:MAG: HAD family phosphatase [Flavobacteriales bacterium]|nr:HAD family phosphatase [Flavobacteriales bacterium]
MSALERFISRIDLKGIKNIIFDFGGVLFEIDYHAPVRAFQKLGFGNFTELYSQGNQDPIFDQLETGKISGEEFLAWLNSHAPNIQRSKILEAWNCILIGLWNPHAELVKNFQEQGFRTFIFSNTNAIHAPVFEKMVDETYGLEKFQSHFEKIIYSHELGLRKPHVEAFQKVCTLYNLNPAETLFIDDSSQHVEGAGRAGLRATQFVSA